MIHWPWEQRGKGDHSRWSDNGAGAQTLGFLAKSIYQAEEIHLKSFSDVLIMTRC